MTTPLRRTLTESETQAIADKLLAQLRPLLAPPPLHEMREQERTDYANEVWARAGIIPNRPNVGRTISDGGAK